ncbi:MAG: thioredoxin-related protein [Bacteroidetes bacterium]|nr:thioredoxin-related protein [Bacteroidota bacterium]
MYAMQSPIRGACQTRFSFGMTFCIFKDIKHHMKKYFAIIAIVAISLCSFKWEKPAAPAENGHIKWLTWAEAQAAQKKAPKKIFVDVYTDWCGWCKRMDATTFENPAIAKYMSENFYCVKFNAETKEEIIFKGQKYGNDGRTNSLATFLLQNRMSYPTTVYLDEELNLLSVVPGYLDPKAAEPVLSYFGTNSYKTTAWEDYQKNFKGSL